MPDLDLDAIEARCNAATEAPWECEPRPGLPLEIWAYDGAIPVCDLPPHVLRERQQAEADAAFILHAREDVPTLIRRIRQLEAELARLRQAPG